MNPAPSVDSNRYYVYLLRSQQNKSFYIGYTNKIERRLDEHNDGSVEYTCKYKPWNLIYYESFLSLVDAKKREKALKQFGKGYSELKRRIENSLTV